MSGPWEDFSKPKQSGPWNDFKPTAPALVPAPNKPPAKSSLTRRVLGDFVGVDVLGRGTLALGETAVGLANIPTLGRAGKALESIGYDPQRAHAALSDLYSPERKEANQKVEQAEGFVDTAFTALENPSTIVGAVGQSIPSILGGGAIARGAGLALQGLRAPTLAAIPRASSGRMLLGAGGEGAVIAGSSAEGIRQETADGLLTPKQAAISLGVGLGSAVLGAGGAGIGRLAGIGDIDTLVAGGAAQAVGQAAKGRLRRGVEGAVVEGALEEMPQSMLEQAGQNVALGNPVGEGVPEAAAMGLLTGGAIGGPIAALNTPQAPPLDRPAPVQTPPAEPPVPLGSLQDAARTVNQQTAPQPAAAPAAEEQEAALRAAVDAAPTPEARTQAQQELASWLEGAGRLLEPPQTMVADSAGNVQANATTPPQILAAPTLRMPSTPGGPASVQQAAPVRRPFPNATPGSLSDAANAIAESAPPVEQPQPLPAAPPLVTPRGNVDPATGEITGPTDDQVRGAITSQLNAGTGINKKRLLGALPGLTPERLNQLVAEVTAARKGDAVQSSLPLAAPSESESVAPNQPDPAASPAVPEQTAAPAATTTQRGAAASSESTDQSLPSRAEPAPVPPSSEGTRPDTSPAPVASSAPVYDETPEQLDDDIVPNSGTPFTIRSAAESAAKRAGDGARVIELEDGGFVVRMPKVQTDGTGRGASAAGVPAAVATVEADRGVGTGTDLPSSPVGAAAPAAAPATAEAGAVAPVAAAAAQAATSPTNALPEPTEAQKEAGNYKKGHARVQGLDISIENPAGTSRRPEWPPLKNHYGYIKGTVGKDKDHIDVFLGDRADDPSLPVFVIDQRNANGKGFDEHKVIMGAATEKEARAMYLSNYSKGWKGTGAITQMTQDEFRAWVRDPEATKRPASRLNAKGKKPASTEAAETPPSMRTAAQVLADTLRKQADELLAQATNNGRRAPDARWIEGAIKRAIIDGAAKPMLAGKQVGAMASAKIALSKAKTLDDVRRIADKLGDADSTPAASTLPEPPPERRTDPQARDRIEDLPADERDAEIQRLRGRVEQLEAESRISEKAGISNRKAFEEDEALGWPTVSAIDMDGLGRVNDTIGHDAADKLLRRIGDVMKSNGNPQVRFYHLNGDEFAARGADPEVLAKVMAEVQSELDAVQVELKRDEDGTVYFYDGIGISYGLGDNYAEADTDAYRSKGEREAAGLRQPKGEPGAPRRLRQAAPEGDVQREVQPAAEEVAPPIAPSTGAAHQNPGEAAEPATPAVIQEAAQTVQREPTVSMKEARERLLTLIDEAIKNAPAEKKGSADDPRTSAPYTRNGVKVRDVTIDRKTGDGLDVPTLTIAEKSSGGFSVNHKGTYLGEESTLLGARLLAGRMLLGATWTAEGGPAGKWNFVETPLPNGYVTLKVPGNGQFKVRNTRDRLEQFRKQVAAQFKKLPDSRIQDVAGWTNTPSLSLSAAKRAEILAVEGSASEREADAEIAARAASRAASEPPYSPLESNRRTAELAEETKQAADRGIVDLAKVQVTAGQYQGMRGEVRSVHSVTATARITLDQGGAVVEVPVADLSAVTEETARLKNYSWDAVKLADAYGFDQLEQLRQEVTAKHANPRDDENGYTENGSPTIYLYDREGRRKLDKLAWAVTYKLQESRAEREAMAKKIAEDAPPPSPPVVTAPAPRNIPVPAPEPSAPPEPVKMTMAEWKATHKDFKGRVDGQRTILRGGRIVPVEIVKEEPESAAPTAAPVSSVEGQKNLASRASRIASLNAMNEQIRKLDPTEAWHPDNIADSKDLDALQDSISETLVRLQREAAAKQPEIPEGFKPSGEPYYSGPNRDTLVQGYAKFPKGSRVKLETGTTGTVIGHIGSGPIFDRHVVRFDNGPELAVLDRELRAADEAPKEDPRDRSVTADEAIKEIEWVDMGTRGDVKTLRLRFRGMAYGELEKAGKGKWGFDGFRYDNLGDAKEAATANAIERLRADGYVTKEPLVGKFSAKEFDAWLAKNTKADPSQMRKDRDGNDPGVGYISVRVLQDGERFTPSATGGKQVKESGIADVFLYRTDDGKLVWWDSLTGNAYEASESDPRVRITKAATAKEESVEVERDGEVFTITLGGPVATATDADVADAMYVADIPKDVQPLFREKVAAARRGAGEATPPTSTPGKVENFGEALPGGRRRTSPSLDRELTDDEIASQPLSKIWPADEIDGIEDKFEAALSYAIRGIIPTKPRKAGAVRRWVETVKVARSMAKDLLRLGGRDEIIERMRKDSRALEGFSARVAVLEAVEREQWKRVGEVREYPGAYRYEGDKKIDSPFVQVEIDGKNERFSGAKSIAEVIEKVQGMLSGEAEGKKLKFEIRYSTKTGEAFINKTGDKEYRKLKTFGEGDSSRENLKQARAYLDSNYDDLVAEWEKVKDRDNVGKTDMRNAENRPRTAKDHRGGKDATDRMFMDAFGFKGVEFGKWVSQGKGAKERQGLINEVYDAFLDLSEIIGVPPRALSLNGTLGLALGSRGGGWASAHFEPNNLVINLTKTRGAGALAHEWFHALDNYFARQRGGEVPIQRGMNAQQQYRLNNYITYRPEPMYVHKSQMSTPLTRARLVALHKANPKSGYYQLDNWEVDPKHPKGVRPEVEARFADLVKALDESPMAARARSIDQGKEGYWSRIIERGARAFENYVIARMMEKGFNNDFLANVRSIEDFPRSADRYPYLLPEEVAPVAEAFDALFETLETRTDEQGNVGLFSRAEPGQAVRFTPSDSLPKRMAMFVDEAVGGRVRPTDTYVLGPTPDVLIEVGAPNIGLELEGDAVLKMLSGKHSGAGITAEQLKSLPSQLADPLAVFESTSNPGALVVLTQLLDKAGRGVIAAVHLNKRSGRGVVNRIESVHGRNDGELVRWAKNGKLRYYNDEALGTPTTGPLELGKVVQAPQGLPNKVLRKSDMRNTSARSRPESKPAAGTPVDTVQNAVDRISAGWRGDVPTIRVIESARSLPDEAKRGEGWETAEGYYDGQRTIYLVANNLPNLTRAAQVLAHEAFGHYGVEGVLGGAQWAQVLADVQRMRANPNLSPKIRAALQSLHDRYRREDPVTYAREALAVMAELDVGASVLDRVLAAVRRWLRSMGFDMKAFGEAELRTVVSEGMRRVREGGKRGDAVPTIKRAGAFAQQDAPLSESRFADRYWRHVDIKNRGNPQAAAAAKDAMMREGWKQGIGPNIMPARRYAKNDNSFDARQARAYEPKPGDTVYLVPPAGRQRERPKIREGWKPEPFEVVTIRDGESLYDAYVRTFNEAKAVGAFSRPDPAGTIELSEGAKESVKSWLERHGKGKLTDLKPALLAAIPLTYLGDYAKSGMTAVKRYIDQVTEMSAYRNKLHREYDAIAQRWLDVATDPRFGGLLGRKVNSGGQAVADLMHDTTIAGIDPTRERDEYRDDPRKLEAYDTLRARFDALPEPLQGIYRDVRDAYTKQVQEMEKVIEANIQRVAEIALMRAERAFDADVREINDDPDMTDAQRAKAIEDAKLKHNRAAAAAKQAGKAKAIALRQKFESMRVEAPYFPLKRFGQFFVAIRDANTGRLLSFSKHETMAEAQKMAEDQGGPGKSAFVGLDSEKDALREAMDPQFIADIDEILAGVDVPDGVRDAIYQRYLETLPDLSLRKSFIHRKKVPGYNPDALRSFSSTMFHGSYQLARLKYGMEMGETLDQAEEQAAAVSPVEGMALVNELRKRNQWVMNPQGTVAGQVATTAAFVWFLGANPAHLFLNASQTAMLGIPILGAKYGGFSKASRALMDASSDYLRGKTHTDKSARLTADERRAMETFIESGLIEKTQAHDLAGVGDKGVEYSAMRQRIMGKIAFFFHESERFNREVTGLAAYRLARKAGRSHDAAVDEAARRVWEIHFNYGQEFRPRFMQGDIPKVLTVFRNWNVNILYRLFRDINDSMRGESPQARKEARMQLGAMMGMFAMMAGVTGLPFYGLAMAIAGALDDEDDPMTAEMHFKQGVVEFLGEDAARYVLGGVPGAAIGLDLSERIGLPNLWFRSPDRELEGQDAYFYWMEQVLGAAPAIVKNVMSGLRLINQGHVWRGTETMLPNMLKQPLRAMRFGLEGEATTLDGDKVVDTGAAEVTKQLLGFTPGNLAEQYDLNRAIKNADVKLLRRRSRLLNRFAMAVKQKDEALRRETLDAMKEFSAKNPAYAITNDTIRRSLRTRQRNDALNTGGVVMTPRLLALQRQMAAGS